MHPSTAIPLNPDLNPDQPHHRATPQGPSMKATRHTRSHRLWLLVALFSAGSATLGYNSITAQTPPAQPAASETPSPDDVMRKLDAMIQPIDETGAPTTQPSTTQPADTAQEPIVNPDKKFIRGVAPDVRVQAPRREDQFILNRVGRLVVIEPGKSLFIFDADQQTAQEQPMMVVPCSKLELMENLTRDRGDQLRFIISGQILTYRDVNYLLPTIVRETEARGNLNQ
jgi:hypothetical protein